MKYRVLRPFANNNKLVRPTETVELDDERAAHLRRHRLIGGIETAEHPTPERAVQRGPRHVGGGWYELPNGKKVRKSQIDEQ